MRQDRADAVVGARHLVDPQVDDPAGQGQARPAVRAEQEGHPGQHGVQRLGGCGLVLASGGARQERGEGAGALGPPPVETADLIIPADRYRASYHLPVR